jgi:sensor histidine kinase regulating citrate/malate metabolism
MPSIAEAIIAIEPNASFTVGNESVDEITWYSTDVTKPTAQQINDKLVELEAAERLEKLRTERNAKLVETDHYGLSDLTMTDAMSAYRQALRDITDTYSSLDDVVWPTKP